MENKGAATTSEIGQNKGGAESEKAQQDIVLIQDSFSVVDTAQFSVTDSQSVSKVVRQDEPRHSDYPSTEVSMEATINPEDVIRAGGFGARDDISSLLPIASDSTDFEASLLDARGYEEPQGEQRRPGLGWKEDRVSE
ncbi:unnamed protein product [Amaranthus hypochondriacus]